MTFHDDPYSAPRADDWEERVARALEMQQKPKRPVWRLVLGVIVAMVAAYGVLSFAFRYGQDIGQGAVERSSPRLADSGADRRGGVAQASLEAGAPRASADGLRSSASLNTLDEDDEAARLFRIRTGVSDGVRRAYRVDEARSGVERGVERGLQAWDGGGAPRAPGDARAALDPRIERAVLSESPVRAVDGYTPPAGTPDPFQPLDPARNTPAAPPPPPASAPTPEPEPAVPTEPAAPVEPVGGFSPRAPAGLWIAAPGVSVATEFTVTPEGAAIDVTVPESALRSASPPLLSAAVNAVSRARFPISPSGGAYRGRYTVRFAPSGEGGAASPRAGAPAASAPDPFANDPFAEDPFPDEPFADDPFAPDTTGRAPAGGATAGGAPAATPAPLGGDAFAQPAAPPSSSRDTPAGGFDPFFDSPIDESATFDAGAGGAGRFGAATDPSAGGAANPAAGAASGASVYGQPVWLAQPTPYDVAAFYPPLAARAGIAGNAILSCEVREDGGLKCIVVSQSPTGMGFGPAALEVARGYTAAPTLDNGARAPGARVTLPVRFDPTATP